MDKKTKVNEIIKRLSEKWPDPKIELQFSNPFELLIATILSAQTTDVRVNSVTRAFFKDYPTPEKVVQENPDVIAEKIKSTGFYRNKAKSLIACCEKLISEFGGEVPKSVEELTRLPGVGRKTANVVLGNAYNIPGIVVDTHVKRVAARLGLSQSTSAEDVEKDLMEIVEKDKWVVFSKLLILHGRYICKSRNPRCDQCVLADICDSEEKTIP